MVRIVPAWDVQRPLTAPDDFANLAKLGYSQNAVINACVRELATSAAEPRLLARSAADDAPLPPEHPLSVLLEHPNDDLSTYDLLEGLVTHLQIGGNAFVHKVRSGAGVPVELWLLRPDRVRVVFAADGSLARYEYGGTGMRGGEPVRVEDVIHFQLPNPTDDFWGLSPLAVLAAVGDLDTQAMLYLRSFFVNGAVPLSVLKTKVTMTPAQRAAVGKSWEEQFRGDLGVKAVGVLDADADFEVKGVPPDKLDMGAVFGQTEARIAAVLGVPPILVGLHIGLLRSTYSNYQTARRSFWEETLAPLYRNIAARLTAGLAREFGGGIRVEFDLSKVRALQENEVELRRFAVDAWNSGLMTRAEARGRLGLDDLDSGRPVFKPASAFGAGGPGQRALGRAPGEAFASDRAKRATRAARFRASDIQVRAMRDLFSEIAEDHGRDALLELAAGAAAEIDPAALGETLAALGERYLQRALNDHAKGIGEIVEQGRNVVDELRDFFQERLDHAEVVALTETVGAANGGRFAAWESAGVEQHEWVTQRDDRVRDSHAAQDQEVVAVGMAFKNGLLYPGDPAGPPGEVINCILPGTVVSGRFVGALKAMYAGEAVKVETRRGHRVAVTVNHPVCTPGGTVAAGELREGDHVVCQEMNVDRSPARRCDEEQQEPARVEDVFDALAARGAARVHRPCPLDLDGDGEFLRGEIHEVVLPRALTGTRSLAQHGLLVQEDEAARGELSQEIGLVAAEVASGASWRADDVVVLSPAARPRRRALMLDARRVVAEMPPLEELRLGPTARLGMSLYEAAADDGAGNAEFFRELLLARPSDVSVDEVVKVERFDFLGHVFDLSTSVGYFASGNILSRNCRCTTQAAGGTSSLDADAVWERFAEATGPEIKRVAEQFRETVREQERRVMATLGRKR